MLFLVLFWYVQTICRFFKTLNNLAKWPKTNLIKRNKLIKKLNSIKSLKLKKVTANKAGIPWYKIIIVIIMWCTIF